MLKHSVRATLLIDKVNVSNLSDFIKKSGGWVGGWVGWWMDGWKCVKAGLRIAYSN